MAARSIDSWVISTAPASSRDRSSRSVASLVSRPTCSCISRRNSSRVAWSRSGSSSSSRKPASENSGVRSSWEALAMKSLRARSTRERRRLIASNARARAPSSSGEWSPIGWSNSPTEIRAAAASRRRNRLDAAYAAPQPTAQATAIASAVAIRIRRSTRSAIALTSDTCWAIATTPPGTANATTMSPLRGPPAHQPVGADRLVDDRLHRVERLQVGLRQRRDDQTPALERKRDHVGVRRRGRRGRLQLRAAWRIPLANRVTQPLVRCWVTGDGQPAC